MRGMHKELRKIFKQLEAQGWEIGQTQRQCHYWAQNPKTRQKVFMSGTPSDHRAIKNARSQLRRAGAHLD